MEHGIHLGVKTNGILEKMEKVIFKARIVIEFIANRHHSKR